MNGKQGVNDSFGKNYDYIGIKLTPTPTNWDTYLVPTFQHSGIWEKVRPEMSQRQK